MKRPSIANFEIWLIYIVSLFVPFSIIHWGIGHDMLFHPDEIYFNIANVVNLIAHTEKLEFFNYPHYLFNLTFIVFHILEFSGLNIDTLGIAYIGRVLVALHYAGCVVVIFKTLTLLNFSRVIIYLCTLLSALLPAFIMHSVFITDLPMTFYILLTGYFCLKSNITVNPKLLTYSAICVGFATACKFTAALSGLMVLCSLLQFRHAFSLSISQCIKKLITYAGLSLLTFSILSPLSILHINDLVNGLLYELAHVQDGHLGQETLTHSVRYWPIIYPFTALLPFGLGPLLFFGTFGLIYLVRRKETRAIGIFSLVWFLAFGILTFQPLRYQFPVMAFSIIGFAFLLHHLNHALHQATLRKAAYVCFVIGIAGQLYYSLTFIDRYRHDTRIEARNWLESTLPADSDIIFFHDQAYNPVPTYSPIEHHYFNQASWYSHGKQANMMIGNQQADYLVLSSINYLRDYRDKTNNLFYIHQTRNNQANWELIKRFSDRHFAKRALFFLDPYFSTYFLSPDIEIYKRKANVSTLPTVIDFGEYGNSHLFTSRHWHRSYEDSRWMKSNGGELTLRLAPEYRNNDLVLDMQFRLYSDQSALTFTVTYNNRTLHTVTLSNANTGTSELKTQRVIIPADIIKSKEHFTLKFQADKFTRPANLFDKLEDRRLLSIGFEKITIGRR